MFYVCNSPARKISRFLHLAFDIKISHVTKRSEENATITLFNASKLGKPSSIVSDRLPGYNISVKSAFPNLKYIKVQSFADDITNNLIESYNKTFKFWYKSKLGFKSFDSANNMVNLYFKFHFLLT